MPTDSILVEVRDFPANLRRLQCFPAKSATVFPETLIPVTTYIYTPRLCPVRALRAREYVIFWLYLSHTDSVFDVLYIVGFVGTSRIRFCGHMPILTIDKIN